MACMKHFACNSMENARFQVDVVADERALHEVYLPHFKRVASEGVAAVMSAYNSLNGHWCGDSHPLLTGILRDKLGLGRPGHHRLHHGTARPGGVGPGRLQHRDALPPAAGPGASRCRGLRCARRRRRGRTGVGDDRDLPALRPGVRQRPRALGGGLRRAPGAGPPGRGGVHGAAPQRRLPAGRRSRAVEAGRARPIGRGAQPRRRRLQRRAPHPRPGDPARRRRIRPRRYRSAGRPPRPRRVDRGRCRPRGGGRGLHPPRRGRVHGRRRHGVLGAGPAHRPSRARLRRPGPDRGDAGRLR